MKKRKKRKSIFRGHPQVKGGQQVNQAFALASAKSFRKCFSHRDWWLKFFFHSSLKEKEDKKQKRPGSFHAA
jgi:hypothetical protein